jgi:hypothetical protein
LSVDPNAIMEASYVCETSGLDSSLITPKDQHIKNTVLNKFISHIFLWPGRGCSPWLFNLFKTKIDEFISHSIQFVIMLFFYHYLNKKCVLPFKKCRYYTYILLHEILWLLISHLIFRIQFTTLKG